MRPKSIKPKTVRLNLRITEAKMRLLVKKANRSFDGNLSEAIRKAIDFFLIEK